MPIIDDKLVLFDAERYFKNKNEDLTLPKTYLLLRDCLSNKYQESITCDVNLKAVIIQEVERR
ncbi:MAG: hypothetical protein F6K40_31765 [Okeania sp. SIO3I5]|uniref:hypothetical protein n=1 Tax=Okeania sp. SIO3I5 TaxID=2607805 RepID=UPI0013B90B27|nr:hypothetical protein [Okeania sp. SIO3I5]NEQ40561.1 hypothetical protein [Okeania sp. SIO3I5]